VEGSVFGAISLWFLVYEISLEPMNGFVPNLHGRLVWSLAQTSLKVKGEGHRDKNEFFGPFGGVRMVCVS